MGGWVGGGQGGCEWRSEAFVKIQKKKFFFFGGGGGGLVQVGGSGWMGTQKSSLCENSNKKIGGGGGLGGRGGQVGCGWKSEAFVKIQKKN